MPIGYGYQASGEEGYVNWAEAAKGFTDMLATENKRREDKKAAYDAEDRELANKLANPEYGQYKDGNDFISNYVDNMTKQRLIDSKLFKAGYLKERDYVLKTNNAVDGTTTLFNLQKKYQEEYKGMMEGVNEGSLQAINTFNMSTIDGFADFSKTRAFLDPKSGQVKLAKLKMNPQTGIMEVTNDIVPVGTAMRNMSTRIATYNLDAQTTKDAANLGDLKTAIVQAATLSRAGSVTEYLNSPEMMEKTFPGGKEAADKFREAINNNVESYLALPYNLTSILTQNTGKYGADSFTTDRTLADKDKTKILLKIDPSTGLNTMDETGPHYKEQRQEAYDYAKTQLLSKIDKEKKVQTSTGQLSRNEPSATMLARTDATTDSENLGQQLGKYLTGDLTTATNSNTYLKQFGIQTQKVKVKQADGTEKPMIRFYNNEGKSFDYDPKQKTSGLIKAAVAGIGTLIKDKGLLEDKVLNAAIKEAGGRNVTFDAVGTGYEGPKSYTKDINSYVSSNLDSQIVPNNATETAANLNAQFGGLGFTFDFEDPDFGYTDDIIIYKKGQDASKEKGVRFAVDDKSQVKKILEWLTQNANETEAETFFVNNPDKQAKEEPEPAPAPKPGGPAPRPGGK